MTTFYVKVTTDHDEFHIDTSGHFLRISLTEPEEQGRANTELVTRLSQILGTNVAIVSGHKSRRKRLAVDRTEQEINALLDEVAQLTVS